MKGSEQVLDEASVGRFQELNEWLKLHRLSGRRGSHIVK